jgi:hypothetical protein
VRGEGSFGQFPGANAPSRGRDYQKILNKQVYLD